MTKDVRDKLLRVSELEEQRDAIKTTINTAEDVDAPDAAAIDRARDGAADGRGQSQDSPHGVPRGRRSRTGNRRARRGRCRLPRTAHVAVEGDDRRVPTRPDARADADRRAGRVRSGVRRAGRDPDRYFREGSPGACRASRGRGDRCPRDRERGHARPDSAVCVRPEHRAAARDRHAGRRERLV